MKYQVQFLFAGREWATDVETDGIDAAIEHYNICIKSHPETPHRITGAIPQSVRLWMETNKEKYADKSAKVIFLTQEVMGIYSLDFSDVMLRNFYFGMAREVYGIDANS